MAIVGSKTILTIDGKRYRATVKSVGPIVPDADDPTGNSSTADITFGDVELIVEEMPVHNRKRDKAPEGYYFKPIRRSYEG